MSTFSWISWDLVPQVLCLFLSLGMSWVSTETSFKPLLPQGVRFPIKCSVYIENISVCTQPGITCGAGGAQPSPLPGLCPLQIPQQGHPGCGNGKDPADFIFFHFSLKDFLSFGMFSMKLCQNQQHSSNSICHSLNNRRKRNILGNTICKTCLGLLLEKLGQLCLWR